MAWRLSKATEEWADYKAEMKSSIARRDGWWSITHVFVDAFVEASRRMPYTLGHIAAIGVLIWLFLQFLA